MTRLAFVVPVHGRQALAEACLRQLARTCEQMGPGTSAVLVGDDRFFARLADELGFGWVPAPNRPLGRKWNDGIEFACREGLADYVVPFGSDDVADAELFDELPGPMEIRSSRLSAVVSPDGRRIATLRITYHGGDGVRILPRPMLEKLGFRPVSDDRDRGVDGSMQDRLLLAASGRRPRFVYHDVHELQIVDFKTNARDQRNGYDGCLTDFATGEYDDPWDRLATVYPVAFLDEVRAVYPAGRMVAA